MLFLIATPIGNLKDISFRALETFKACDYLLCEDTRRTRILLDHYQLKIPLKSFHLFNEASKEDQIVEDLKKEKSVGLVSDAGTPGISDPGERLVKRCRQEGIEVIPIPGPCAAITALVASGLTTSRFQFFGFLPRKKGKLTRLLEEILAYEGTTVCYESPYRLAGTLKVIAELDPNRECVVARELTKKFETFLKGSASKLQDHFSQAKPKGEVILLIEGIDE
ncbi:MAG TPA: 16S rRNA (cytidine(1402)-2'-O)-methyltransferase [Waddliaceae bacterium]